MKPQIVVIGTSLGGLDALEEVLGGLDRSFPLPIAIVQHRSKTNPDLLATVLQNYTTLAVKDPEDKEVLEAASVYVAPADYHLLVDRHCCALSLEAPVGHSRPSVDVLFQSAADTYGADVVAVVLTGNSCDGALGAGHIKAAGGMVIVQDPADCEAPRMPLSTISSVKADRILKLSEIAPFLKEHCRSVEDDKYGRQ